MLLQAAAAMLMAQAPGSIDAEGNLYFMNGTGRYALQRKGVWRTPPTVARAAVTGTAKATPAEIQTLQASIDKLSAIFRDTPEASAITGYWMRESRYYRYLDSFEAPPAFPPSKLPVVFGTAFFPFYLEDSLKNGQYIPVWGGETDSVTFDFNRLPGIVRQTPIVQETLPNDYRHEIYLKPRVTGTFRGLPLYDDDLLVITRPGRDPWAPVALKQALQMTAKLLEQDRVTAENRLADLKKKNEHIQSSAYEAEMRAHLEKYSGPLRETNPSKWEGRVKGMERELIYNRQQAAEAANPQRDPKGSWYWNPLDAKAQAEARLAQLSAEDAASPACFTAAKGEQSAGRYALRGTIEKLGSDPACEPIVQTNFAYFDLALPRGTPQILVVSSFGRCATVKDGQLVAKSRVEPNRPSQGCARHPVYWEQLDWARVQGLLAP